VGACHWLGVPAQKRRDVEPAEAPAVARGRRGSPGGRGRALQPAAAGTPGIPPGARSALPFGSDDCPPLPAPPPVLRDCIRRIALL